MYCGKQEQRAEIKVDGCHESALQCVRGLNLKEKSTLKAWWHVRMQLWQPPQRVPSSSLCCEEGSWHWVMCGPWLNPGAMMHLLSNQPLQSLHLREQERRWEGKSVRVNEMMEVSLSLPHEFVPQWELLAARLNIKITKAMCYSAI